ncbi:hypothetical protein [Xanthomonas translucens]|nr:hypothetical protein [Xanthomonas translucens]MCC8447854.1 hypothetical protein [Xanthomonas translucens pv. translucens]MCS3361761.1 hypothetical protein [Xanthomonas translucens pv. translucens]MCS3375375.1 hypothetical protein [Xanthomonas translucens pv. translucens]MCT8276400.1 hypothetical protein [Xanthomonas translucens pv. translucens]MCT8280153.1 hypothetical protein [Xanthomonas translucens pv. translucens]
MLAAEAIRVAADHCQRRPLCAELTANASIPIRIWSAAPIRPVNRIRRTGTASGRQGPLTSLHAHRNLCAEGSDSSLTRPPPMATRHHWQVSHSPAPLATTHSKSGNKQKNTDGAQRAA